MVRAKTIADNPQQLLYARLCKLQKRTNKNGLRILQLATQLDRVRKLAAKDPDYTAAQKMIPQLEKMMQLARAVEAYDRAAQNELWKKLR